MLAWVLVRETLESGELGSYSRVDLARVGICAKATASKHIPCGLEYSRELKSIRIAVARQMSSMLYH